MKDHQLLLLRRLGSLDHHSLDQGQWLRCLVLFRRIRSKLQSNNQSAQRVIRPVHLKNQALLAVPAPKHHQALNHRTAGLIHRRDRSRLLLSRDQGNCLKVEYLTQPKLDTYSVAGTSHMPNTSRPPPPPPYYLLDRLAPALWPSLNTSDIPSSRPAINMKSTTQCRISNDSSRLVVRIRRRSETSHPHLLGEPVHRLRLQEAVTSLSLLLKTTAWNPSTANSARYLVLAPVVPSES